MNRKTLAITTSAILLAAAVGAGLIWHNETRRQHLAETAPQFLYAVDPATNHVLTYSSAPGEVKMSDDLFQVQAGRADNVLRTAWDGCWYSYIAACPAPVAAVMIIQHPHGDTPNYVKAGDGVRPVLPRIVWTDGTGSYQQQFFKKGEIVYLSDHPLKTNDDDILLDAPRVDAKAANGA